MEELTREEMDFLYTKPEKNNINKKIKYFISSRTVELMVVVGLFIFLWDKILKHNRL